MLPAGTHTAAGWRARCGRPQPRLVRPLAGLLVLQIFSHLLPAALFPVLMTFVSPVLSIFPLTCYKPY
jgi:hypothetical protein